MCSSDLDGLVEPCSKRNVDISITALFSSCRKILKTRVNLSRVIEKNDSENPTVGEGESSSPSFLDDVKVPELLNLRGTSEESGAGVLEGDSTTVASGPKLYVRDDGTVDWEGALQDRAALRKFGGAVWARINGQTPDDLGEETNDPSKGDGETVEGDAHQSKPAVTAKIEDTPSIQDARKELNRLEDELKEKEKAHTALVESGKCREASKSSEVVLVH